MEDEDTFKDIYEIIQGIGKEWENLSDIEQAKWMPVYIVICTEEYI